MRDMTSVIRSALTTMASVVPEIILIEPPRQGGKSFSCHHRFAVEFLISIKCASKIRARASPRSITNAWRKPFASAHARRRPISS